MVSGGAAMTITMGDLNPRAVEYLTEVTGGRGKFVFMPTNDSEAQVKYMTDKIPMKRCCTLPEVAALAAWIVSPEASFNTGFTFDLTGGRAVY